MKNKNTFYVDSEGKFVSYALVYADLSLDRPRACWDKELTNPVSFKDGISLINNIYIEDVSSVTVDYPAKSRPYNFYLVPKDDAASLLPNVKLDSDAIQMCIIVPDNVDFKVKCLAIYDEIV